MNYLPTTLLPFKTIGVQGDEYKSMGGVWQQYFMNVMGLPWNSHPTHVSRHLVWMYPYFLNHYTVSARSHGDGPSGVGSCTHTWFKQEDWGHLLVKRDYYMGEQGAALKLNVSITSQPRARHQRLPTVTFFTQKSLFCAPPSDLGSRAWLFVI